MRLELTARNGVDVVVGDNLGFIGGDTMAAREWRSQEFFRKIDGSEEWSKMKKTVETELRRLADTVGNWLPTSMNPQKEGLERPIDIQIRIWPDCWDEDTPLSREEELKAAAMVRTLAGIKEETSE